MATNNSINTSKPIGAADGGTGATTLTGVLTGNGTGVVTANAVTQYGTVIAGASNAITSVAPSATVGVALVSGGAAVNPAYGTVVIAGGGTNATSMTNTFGVNYFDGTRLVTTAVGTAAQVLTSNGAGVAPTFQAGDGGIVTIAGDSGSATGATVTLTGGTTGAVFTGGAATVTQTFVGITANGGTVSLATDATTSTINVGTGAGVKTSTFGSNNTTSATTLRSGSGALAVTATGGTLTVNSGTGALSISNDASATTVTLATGGAVKGLTVGSTNSTSATTVQCGSGALAITSTGGTWTGNSGTGALGLSTDASATTISIGTGGAVKAITLGSINTTSATTVRCGSGALNITSNVGIITINSAGGAINVGTDAANHEINIGTNASSSKTIAIGAIIGNTGVTIRGGNGSFLLSNVGTSNSITLDPGTGGVTVNTFVGLPSTTSTVGQIRINGNRFLHAHGSTNTFAGINSGNFTATQGHNTGFGHLALRSLSSGIGNTAIGSDAMIGTVTGNYSTSVGFGAGKALTSGGNNTAIGVNSLLLSTADIDNVAVGFDALQNCNGGNSNTGIGRRGGGSITTGDENTAVGMQSMYGSAGVTGSQNSALGNGALAALTSGTFNTCLGYTAGGSQTTGSSSVYINSNGVAAESNTLRVGAGAGAGSLQLNRAFVHGIRGITTAAADAINVLISSTGQLGTVSSSIRYKENVVDMGDASSSLLSLRPVTFDFIGKPSHKRQVGLIAEEVKEIMPDLVVHNMEGEVESVKYHDLPALLLNELQKAIKRIEVLESKLASLVNK